MKTQPLKAIPNHLILTALMLSALYTTIDCASSFAHESAEHGQHTEATASSLKDKNHSFQGLLVPFVLFNSLQLAYEYKITSKLGIRADGFLILSLGGSAAAGGLGLSYIAVEGKTDSASHGLELDLGVIAGVTGSGHCDTAVEECSGWEGQLIKGFVGYRYQKFSGFQLRMGLAPLMSFKGEFEVVLPELTLGVAF